MECHICYEDKKEHQMKKLDCKHSLCKDCFNKLRNNTCPFCRRLIKGKKIYNECINRIQIISHPHISIEEKINNAISDDISNIFSSKMKNKNRQSKLNKKQKKKKYKLLKNKNKNKNKNKYNKKDNKFKNNLKEKYSLLYNDYFSD